MAELVARAGKARTLLTTLVMLRRERPDLFDAATGIGLWVLFGAFLIFAVITDLQLVVVGIILGSIVALGAIGLTLVYGIMKFANFAHGDMMMCGAYLAFFAFISGGSIGPLSFGYGMILAILVAMISVGVGSVVIDRLVYHPLRQRGSGVVVFAIASLGLAITFRALILLWWGPQPQIYVTGIHPAWDLPFGVKIKPDQIFIIATTLFLIAAVYVLLFRTRIGKAMRAMSDNLELARVSGINPDQVIMWTWLIGGSLAAVAGVLLGIQSQLTPDMGFSLLLPLFAATILGGIGSPHGALTGAMVVSIAQQVSTSWIDPGYKVAVAFILLILMLAVRPRGLFGMKT